MNKKEFLLDQNVSDFINWASVHLLDIIVDFNISKKGTGSADGRNGPGLKGKVIGLNAVTNAYHWRGDWKNDQGGSVISSDWASSRESLSQLSKWLKEEVASGSDVRALSACDAVLSWGGDRNSKQGARPFLKSKAEKGQLTTYLSTATSVFSLDTADTSQLGHIEEMNSMLTKIHALLSDDGLPIYDSRVAASIASLVEIYSKSTGKKPFETHEHLAFKAVVGRTDKDKRRRVIGLSLDTPMFDPGVISRAKNSKKNSALEWSSAKVRLAWLIESILERAEQNDKPIFEKNTFLDDTSKSRMHAFEAALFMIGFDVKSLSY